MIKRFLKWWFTELAALLPDWLSGRGRSGGQRLHLRLRGERVQVSIEGAGVGARELANVARSELGRLDATLAGALADVDPERTRCQVELPESLVLSREVELPLAAEENLHEVLAFEMDRQTPFRASDVYFNHRVLERDGARQRLRVLLQVATRGVVDRLLVPVGHWELRPVAAQSSSRTGNGDGGGSVTLEFLPAVYRERSHARLNAVLAVLALALAFAVVYVPLSEQRAYREDLARQLAEARGLAADAVAVRERLEARRAATHMLVEAKAGRPSMVELIEALTQALPDDTHLFRLEVRDGEVSLQGSSGAASALIATLESSEMLRDVRFASPVTRDGASGRERFHISAKLAGAGTEQGAG